MRTLAALALLLLADARAQDEGEAKGDLGGGSTEAEASGGISDIEVDIDLSGPGAEESATYEGGFTQRSKKVASNAAVSVSAASGTVTVRCTDTEFVEARVDYVLDGTNKDAMKRMGDGIGLATWGEGTSGGVKLAVPSKPSGVKTANIKLTVNVPKTAKLSVTASGDWIQVGGCNGSVTANAGRNGAYVEGDMTAFTVSAGSGDVKVVLGSEAVIKGNSAINAPKGNATLVMPISQNLKFAASGASVSVTHSVLGAVTPASVTGAIGAGGPSLTIKASGDVTVKTP